jgi:hypothetical protein
LIAIGIALAVAGCGDRTAANGGEPSSGAAALDPGAPPPISSRGEPVGGAPSMGGPGGGAAAAGSIRWQLPEGWLEQPPENPMRLTQAAIPGPDGPGEVVVFYFGPGGGGGVEANLSRWVGQMELTPGTQPSSETFEAADYRVTLLDVSGTMQPSNMGTGPETPQPGWRMLAAVVEGPGGPWFFKATGPEATLAAARDDFEAMLRGIEPGG